MALFQEFSWLDCIHDFWFQPTSIIDKCQHFDYCNVAETLALMIIDVKNLDLNFKKNQVNGNFPVQLERNLGSENCARILNERPAK